MMPGASHRVIDKEPLCERAVIVRALSADREDVSAATHEKNRVLSDMAGELGAVWQFGGGDSQRQIGTGELRLIFSHFVLPGLSSRACFTTRRFPYT
jgi:hypothetical protein